MENDFDCKVGGNSYIMKFHREAYQFSGVHILKIAALILGIFSGLGHILLNKNLKGTIFGVLFVICLNGIILGSTVMLGTVGTSVLWSSIGCTIAVWVIAYRDLVLTIKSKGNDKSNVD